MCNNVNTGIREKNGDISAVPVQLKHKKGRKEELLEWNQNGE